MVNGYLTEEQRKHWDEQGYLIVKQVLSPDEVRTLLESVDSVIEGYVRETDGPDAPGSVEALSPSSERLKEQMR